MDETRSFPSQSLLTTIAVIAAIAAIFGGYYWYSHRSQAIVSTAGAPAASTSAAPGPAVTAPAASTESAVMHPIDERESDHSTPREQRDAKFLDALSQVGGWRASALRLLVPTDLIRHIVATVDALTREKLALQTIPTKPVAGVFRVTRSDRGDTIAASNERRYEPYVAALTSLDTAQAAALYRHFYPLFQQAYRDLGYPKGYFNDRLVEVIDELLEAPDPKPPIEVVAPRAMFHYVDPDLEALSPGQKILVRVGPSNESAIKAKLREFRQAVTTP